LALDHSQSIHRFNRFLEILTIVSTIFWPFLKAILFIDPIIHFVENLTVLSSIFWPWITAKLSIDLIVLLLEKLIVVSIILLALDFSQYIHRFNRSF